MPSQLLIHFLKKDFAFYDHSTVNQEINTDAVIFSKLQTFSKSCIVFH